MLTITGLAENYKIRIIDTEMSSLCLEIEDKTNNLVFRGVPIKFEYFVGGLGKYEFKAVFRKYTARSE